jgi:hypothetical protein
MPYKNLKLDLNGHSYQNVITSMDGSTYDLMVSVTMTVKIAHKKALIFQGFLLFKF